MLTPVATPGSRCTGYRPILDAFRVFAKTDAKAYTEEAIAAASGGTPNGDANGNGVANGSGAANGDGNGKVRHIL